MEENNITECAVKKKGRPRKNPVVEETPNELDPDAEIEKKKRGRKKKEKVEEEEPKQKKKRGRKAAVKFFSSSIRKQIPLTAIIQDNDKNILHIDVKDIPQIGENENTIFDGVKSEYLGTNLKLVINSSQISDIKDSFDDRDELEEYIEDNLDISISDLYEKRLESRMSQDKILIKRLENLHNDENLVEKLIYNKSCKKVECGEQNMSNINNGYFGVLGNLYESDRWLETSDVCCWWCCNKFTTVPVGLPLKYLNGKFVVKGVFCTFGCMIAHNNSCKKKESSDSLISFLFKKMTGVVKVQSKESYRKNLERSLKLELFGGNVKLKEGYIEALVKLSCENLRPAPPREALSMFGGRLSIEEFRNSGCNNKIYKMIEYPMFISRSFIEEVDIQNVKNINENVFNRTLKRNNNILDDQKVEDAKQRIELKNNVVTKSGIDKFLKF